jgi:putative transposase
VGNDFRNRIKKLGFVQSINRPSRMNDNARMESFFGSMKCEWLHGLTFESDDQLKGKIKSYIPFYNYTRLYSSLDYQSPVTFESGANN